MKKSFVILVPSLMVLSAWLAAGLVSAQPKPTANEIASKAAPVKAVAAVRISGPTKARPSQMVRLVAETDSPGNIQWMPVSDDEFPQLIDDYISPDGATVVRGKFLTFEMPANAPKQTFIILVSGGPNPSMAKWSVSLDGGPTPPQPTPPGPSPAPGPTPGPAPIPSQGLSVLILEETADRGRNEKATAILMSGVLRDYCASHCVKGPDGKTPEVRFLDDDLSEADIEGEKWKAAFKLAKEQSGGTLPWIVISNGKEGESRKLPETLDETMNLLKKYGGQ